jgi:hypothetical protein
MRQAQPFSESAELMWSPHDLVEPEALVTRRATKFYPKT